MVNAKKDNDYNFTCRPNDGLQCADYRQNTMLPDDESEEKEMDFFKRKMKALKQFFSNGVKKR